MNNLHGMENNEDIDNLVCLGLNISVNNLSVTFGQKDSFLCVFSSPEPLGSQGELIGWP